jgi:hypothetical protein
MSPGTWVALLLAAGIVAYVMTPLFRRQSADDRETVASSELLEMQSRHAMTLAALTDLEEDRETGKIDAADYAELKTKLTAQAVEAMKQLDSHLRTHPSIAKRRQAGNP